MKIFVTLVVVTLSALVSCPLLVGSLRCHSTQSCDAGTRFCDVTCTNEFHYCTAFYQITLEGKLQPVLMGCAMGNESIPIPTNCTQNLRTGSSGLIYCNCKSDLCNALYNHWNETVPVVTEPPSPPAPSVVFEKPDENYNGLWCEYRMKNSNGTVVEGYQLCDLDNGFNSGSNVHEKGCYGLYNINPMGVVEPREQLCASSFFTTCNSSTCDIHLSALTSQVYTVTLFCCCNSSGCNKDEHVLHPDHPIYPQNVTHVDHDEHLVCEYTNCTTDKYTGDYHCHTGVVVCSEHNLVRNNLIPSNKNNHSCVAIKRTKRDKQGKIVFENGNYVLEKSYGGCHYSPDENCGTDRCDLVDAGNNMFKCCCRSTLCNREPLVLSTVISPVTSPSPSNEPTTGNSHHVQILIAVVVVCVLLVLLMFATCLGCVFYTQIKLRRTVSMPVANGIANNGCTNIDGGIIAMNGYQSLPCKLVEKIGRGRFSDVWKGEFQDESIAVKIFLHSDRKCWEEEVEVYKTIGLQHPNILSFHGTKIEETSLGFSYWLICEYHPNGSLTDVLEKEVLSLRQFLLMGQSIATGLAHLHKLSIAHRDLKSKNILVKTDGTCCIGDLGLALKLIPGNIETEAQGQVGTTRYMSPEVLEGAISFQSESFLRIDIYALALILWEMTVRCNPHQDKPQIQVLRYQQPYESDIKSPPTIEAMKRVVVIQNIRPEFPSYFQCQKLESIIETIRECWDADTEARLNAKTVQERFSRVFRDLFPAYSGADTWEGTKEYCTMLLEQDDSTKKGSMSNESNGYVSADCHSPSSFDYSSHFLNLTHPIGSPNFGHSSIVPRSSTTSTLPTSPSTYASSEQVTSSTQGLLRSSPPSQYSHKTRRFMQMNETTV